MKLEQTLRPQQNSVDEKIFQMIKHVKVWKFLQGLTGSIWIKSSNFYDKKYASQHIGSVRCEIFHSSWESENGLQKNYHFELKPCSYVPTCHHTL